MPDPDHMVAEGSLPYVESLYGKFATPGAEWEDSELDAFLHETGAEWQKELDELMDDDSTTP